MSTFPADASAAPDSPEAVPFESVPALAANEDYINKMDRLRALREMKDRLFNDKETRTRPLGEYEQLKRECAAIQLCAGQRSVTYFDLRVSRTVGGAEKGKISGQSLAAFLTDAYSADDLARIIASAKDFDPAKLLEAGVPASTIAAATEPGKQRSDSIRVEWVGDKSSSGNKTTLVHGGGAIQ